MKCRALHDTSLLINLKCDFKCMEPLSDRNLPAIACHNIRTEYQSALQRPILNGIDVQINHGEFVALLGMNGAGKSTLLRSLVGLVPIQQGEIQICGTSVEQRHIGEVRKNIGFLFQGGALVDQLSCLDNVLCGCLGELTTWQSLWGFPKSDRRRCDAATPENGATRANLSKGKTTKRWSTPKGSDRPNFDSITPYFARR